MKIIQLHSENFKRLKAVDITPSSEVVKITGRCEQGKTSVLDAIMVTLAGVNSKEFPEPIRKGEKDAVNRLDLGEYIVTRTFTPNGNYLKVENADGAKFSSPQGMLDKLVGGLSFDPLEFAHMEPKKQRETLLKLTGIDPKPLDDKRKKIFDDRTLVNRQIKEQESLLATMTPPAEDTPSEEVTMKTLLDEYNKARETKEQNERQRSLLLAMRADKANLSARIDRIKAEIARLTAELNATETELSQLIERGKEQAALVNRLEDPDVTSINERITSIEVTNKKVRAKIVYDNTKSKHEALKEMAAKLTQQIEAIDQEKVDAIKRAKMPVEGLGVSDDGITFNDIPFEQCSGAQRIKISVGMGMALNPKLRVILIREGSLLDSKYMGIIEEMAREHDFQVWCEIVDESGKLGVVIEDGQVAAVNAPVVDADYEVVDDSSTEKEGAF